MPADDPAALTALLDRVRAGDPAARDGLIRAAQERLEHLARRMLRRHESVRRWADTLDVFQNAALRLLRALEGAPAVDTRGFFNLAAAVIRRELIDQARHLHGPRGLGANHASRGPAADDPDPGSGDPDPAELDRWCALHEAVERLPVEQREVFGLTFYHGWTQAHVGELLGVDERTVRRRWQAACLALNDALGGEVPQL